MLTQCPQCETFFRLTAPQLRAARGMVRCGECEQLFNALDHLHEHIPPSFKPVTEATEESAAQHRSDEDETQGSEPLAESQSPIEDQTEPDPATEVAAASGEDDISLDEFIKEEPQQMSLNEISTDADENDPMDILIEPPSSADDDVMSEKLNLEDLEDLPEVLREDMQTAAESRRGALSIGLWSLSIFLLIMGLATQLGISFQTEIEQRMPGTKPLYERLCVHLPCQTALQHEPVAIKLVARDVRHHPRFRNTLLVNGTLLNESGQTLAYPVLQFELLDPTGTVIGVRQFQPAEYLDKSIAIDEGMPAGRPVHIVMEVLGASESAVSFEFSFL